MRVCVHMYTRVRERISPLQGKEAKKFRGR